MTRHTRNIRTLLAILWLLLVAVVAEAGPAFVKQRELDGSPGFVSKTPARQVEQVVAGPGFVGA